MARALPDPPSFADWTNRLKAYNDYIKALAEYKKAAADAELKRAQAAQEWTTVRAMEVVIRQMDLELQRLNRQTAKVRQDIQKMQQLAKRALLVLSGRRLQGFHRAWSAFQRFALPAVVESPAALYAVTVDPAGHDAAFFLSNRRPKDTCEPLPDHHTTALALADWLQAQRYMARSGTPPQRALAELVREINQVAARQVQKMLDDLAAMRDGTFDAWSPPSIIGVPAKKRQTRVELAFLAQPQDHWRSVPLPPRVVRALDL